MANHKMMKYQDKDNEDEARMDVEQRTTRYKRLKAKQYDVMVKPRHFNIGDLILKRVSWATRNPAHGKLRPNWEGPYRVLIARDKNHLT